MVLTGLTGILFSVAVEPGVQRLLENPSAAHLLHVRVDYGIHTPRYIIRLVSVNLCLLRAVAVCRAPRGERDVSGGGSVTQPGKTFLKNNVCLSARSRDRGLTWRQVTDSPV